MSLIGKTIWIRAKRVGSNWVSLHGAENIKISFDDDGCFGNSQVQSVFEEDHVDVLDGNPDIVPKLGQIWRNTNGRELLILHISKTNKADSVKYIYHDSDNERIYSCSKHCFSNYWTYVGEKPNI